jgi:hypothetical protein
MPAENYIRMLEAAILIMNKCRPTHQRTVFVREEAERQETVWEGQVEVFELHGHKKARRCYAWQHIDARGNARIFVVLDSKLIPSAEAAVQAAIFAGTPPPPPKVPDSLDFLKSQKEQCESLIRQMGIASEDLAAAIEVTKGTIENTKVRKAGSATVQNN